LSGNFARCKSRASFELPTQAIHLPAAIRVLQPARKISRRRRMRFPGALPWASADSSRSCGRRGARFRKMLTLTVPDPGPAATMRGSELELRFVM